MITKMLSDLYFDNKIRLIPPGAKNFFGQVEEVINSFFVAGLINLEETDLLPIIYGCKAVTIITIEVSSENKAEELRRQLNDRMPGDFKVKKPTGVLFNVIGGSAMTLFDVNDLAEVIYDEIDDDANIIFGAVIDEEMKEKVKVVLIFAV